jgi:hypothetical protein
MRFAYYQNLSSRERAIYRRSDDVHAIRLGPAQEPLRTLIPPLREALGADRREEVELAAQRLVDALNQRLHLPPVHVKVLDVRPREAASELHGLYLAPERGQPVAFVWMRTARHRRVVAFRTFLRTLLHELCHHLDFRLLALPESFHTLGFFQRESSLFHQLIPRS